MENQKEKVVYHPVPYIAFVFIITWICAVLLSYSQYIPWQPVLILLDFIESASPLFVSMYLLRKYLNKHFLWKFFFGKKENAVNYLIVGILFILQFWNFYLFRIEGTVIEPLAWTNILLGQILLGGALEEAGWRGYLQPALEKRLQDLF